MESLQYASLTTKHDSLKKLQSLSGLGKKILTFLMFAFENMSVEAPKTSHMTVIIARFFKIPVISLLAVSTSSGIPSFFEYVRESGSDIIGDKRGQCLIASD